MRKHQADKIRDHLIVNGWIFDRDEARTIELNGCWLSLGILELIRQAVLEGEQRFAQPIPAAQRTNPAFIPVQRDNR